MTSTQTPLAEHLAATAAPLAVYRGAETPPSFSDLATELAALRSGCAVLDLSWTAKIIVTGGDRTRWLNGMVTNNVRDLAVDRGGYSFFLNAQGHTLADMYIFNRGEYLIIQTDAAQHGHLLKMLDHYIIMDDVELSSAAGKLASIAVIGPRSGEVLASLGLAIDALAPLQIVDSVWQDVGLSILRRERDHEFEFWLAPENAPRLWDALLAARATPVGSAALEAYRVINGVPLYGQDIRERDLPQETRQSQALHFTKGCYVGQEIVERIHSRGQVRRGLTGFVLDADVPIGAKIELDGREVGEITSVVTLPPSATSSPNAAKIIALGYLRQEAAARENELSAAGARLKIAKLPFQI